MKIYVAHSREMDYEKEIYRPIRGESTLREHTILLPHENGNNVNHTRDFYKEIDLFIAEVSEPATGLGIELGWAYDDKIPIYCLYKEGKKVSSSIQSVTQNFFSYQNEEDFVRVIQEIINKHK